MLGRCLGCTAQNSSQGLLWISFPRRLLGENAIAAIGLSPLWAVEVVSGATWPFLALRTQIERQTVVLVGLSVWRACPECLRTQVRVACRCVCEDGWSSKWLWTHCVTGCNWRVYETPWAHRRGMVVPERQRLPGCLGCTVILHMDLPRAGRTEENAESRAQLGLRRWRMRLAQ